MRINIAASHRFHLLDLAKELSSQGHDVRFYSYLPQARAMQFGLKCEDNSSLFIFMLPFLGLIKLSRRSYWAIKLSYLALDYYLSFFMRPCDVYIALGTVYLKSLITAKKKFGAITIVEWGSKHIVEQQKILSKIPEVKKQPEYFTRRSIQGYKNADYISIPSDHVRQSFISNGIEQTKLIQNPYGVDLVMFPPTVLKEIDIYDLIVVGGWSYQKGYDLLVNLCKKRGYSLLHVGSILDMPFPQEKNFMHINSVEQKNLSFHYSSARVFVLPSRQDGLAMVQAQAIASGLPVVCSKNSGGRDLNKFLKDHRWIIEMQEYSLDDLESCIERALLLSKLQKGIRDYAKGEIKNFSWSAYGDRYNRNLSLITNAIGV